MTDINQATCEAAREPKYLNLLRIDNLLNDILQHIIDINNKVGVNTPIQEPSDNAKTPNIESLVGVIDHLPGVVNNKVDLIHNLLNTLDDNLN